MLFNKALNCLEKLGVFRSTAMADLDRLLDFQIQQTMEAPSWRMPWDVGGFIGLVMGSPAADPTAFLQSPMRLRQGSAPLSFAARQVASGAVAYLPEFKGKREEDDARAVQLGRWMTIVEVNIQASEVGRQLAELQCQESPVSKAIEMLRDVFAAKATNTLERRAGSLLLYVAWAAENSEEGQQVLPIVERVL